MGKIFDFYSKKYKKLLIIPFLMLILAIGVLIWNFSTTGEVINKAVTLKGGVTFDVSLGQEIDSNILNSNLEQEFPLNDIEIKSKRDGDNYGLYLAMDIAGSEEEIDKVLQIIDDSVEKDIQPEDYNVGKMGSSLGASFFKEAIIALIIAFIFMGIVVFLYFKTTVPSLAVILAAVSDIIVTLAIVDLLYIKLSTAGLAAFLMLIGYSVDTDILLSTKVLKRKNGTVDDRIKQAMKTGMMMTATTLSAVIIALILSNSEVLKQIMVVLLIGLLVDLVNTWIQNAGLLKLYLEKKHKKKANHA